MNEYNTLIYRDSGADSIGHGGGGTCPTFTNSWARGHREYTNSKQETD